MSLRKIEEVKSETHNDFSEEELSEGEGEQLRHAGVSPVSLGHRAGGAAFTDTVISVLGVLRLTRALAVSVPGFPGRVLPAMPSVTCRCSLPVALGTASCSLIWVLSSALGFSAVVCSCEDRRQCKFFLERRVTCGWIRI